MISVRFQAKAFSITIIQVYDLSRNAEEAEVEQFYSGWNVGLPLIRCSGQGPHLAMTGEPRGFSRAAAGFSSETGMSGNFGGRIKGAKYRFVLQDGTWDFS